MCVKSTKKIEATGGFKYCGKIYASRYEAAYAKMLDEIYLVFPHRSNPCNCIPYHYNTCPQGYTANEIVQKIEQVAAIHKQFKEDCGEDV